MASKIQLRRDTARNWTANNPILSDGEQGYETDTGKIKIGNGTDDWATLTYKFEATGGSGLTINEDTTNYADYTRNFYYGGTNTPLPSGYARGSIILGDNNLSVRTDSEEDFIVGHNNLSAFNSYSQMNYIFGDYNFDGYNPTGYVYYNKIFGTFNIVNGYDNTTTDITGNFLFGDFTNMKRSDSLGITQTEQNYIFGYYSTSSDTFTNNVIIGNGSLGGAGFRTYNRTNCSALGQNILTENLNLDNVSVIGSNRVVSGSNQVQLGDSRTTTYAYGRVQDRSDKRDKTEIEVLDETLALNFINKIKPSTYKFNYREDYYEIIEKEEIDEKTGIKKIIKEKLEIENDGSKRRNRRHRGVIAQEVKEVMDELGFDFAGYQDHSIKGGKDVLSIGYQEFIPYLISSVQALTKQNEELIKKIEILEAK